MCLLTVGNSGQNWDDLRGCLGGENRVVVWGRWERGLLNPGCFLLKWGVMKTHSTVYFPHLLRPIRMILLFLIPKCFNINSSEVTAGFLSATNRWQPRRVLFPLCQLGGRLTCHHLKHWSLPPARRRLPNTTPIPPRCPLISILKSRGGVSLQLH